MSAGAARITRRAAGVALAAGALGFVAFGPRPSRRTSDGRLVLDYWEKWTGHEAAAMQRVVDAFNESQDRILVRYLSMGAIDAKAQIAIAGGDPPDVIGLWNYNLPAFSQSGAILPLDEMPDPPSADWYTPPVWRLVNHGGRTWALPTTCNTTALFYNRKYFREAGLDPDAPPRTIDELDAATDALTLTDDAGRLTRAGFVHTEPGWWDWIWGYFFGGNLFDEQRRVATADSNVNIRAYEWVQSYPKRFKASRLLSFQSGFGTYFSMQQPFVEGKLAMTLHGCFLANVIRRFKPDLDYGVAHFPIDAELLGRGGPIGMIESDILVVPAGARNPEASYEFIQFVQQRQWMEHLAAVHSKPSPLRTLSSEFESIHPDPWVSVHTELINSDRAFEVPRTRTWLQYRDEFRQAMERIWTLSQPPAAALADVNARAQAAIDQATLQRERRERAGRA